MPDDFQSIDESVSRAVTPRAAVQKFVNRSDEPLSKIKDKIIAHAEQKNRGPRRSEMKKFVKDPLQEGVGSLLVGIGAAGTAALLPTACLGAGLGFGAGLLLKTTVKLLYAEGSQARNATKNADRLGIVIGYAIGSFAFAALFFISLEMCKNGMIASKIPDKNIQASDNNTLKDKSHTHTNFLQKKIQEIRDDYKTKKIMSAEVHFIGRVDHSPHSLGVEDEGRELWQERYGLEAIQIHTTDDQGKPKELHIYATTLKSTFDEWMEKKAKGEIEKGSKEMHFDGYVQSRITPDANGHVQDPALRANLFENHVRFLTDQELKGVKAHFSEDGITQISLKSIDLDPNDREQKKLREGKYAFVIGKENEEPALYLTPKITITEGDKSGKIQHSSFLRSGKVASAGMIEVNDEGKIDTVVQYSGHYLPGHTEMVNVLSFLKENMSSREGQKEFNEIRLSINKYTGLMLKITMGINTLAERYAHTKLDLGMVDVNAAEWLSKKQEGFIKQL